MSSSFVAAATSRAADVLERLITGNQDPHPMSSSFVAAATSRAADVLERLTLGPPSPVAPRPTVGPTPTGGCYDSAPTPMNLWDWGCGRLSDDSVARILADRNIHGDGGAYVGGEWVDIEDLATKFYPDNPSHTEGWLWRLPSLTIAPLIRQS